MLNKFSNWLNNSILDVFLIFFILLVTFPILAPIFAHFGADTMAKAIYTVYSFFCHQQDWKSLHLFDYQIAWCTRDMFIWGSMLVVLIVLKYKKIEPLSFVLFVLYAIPMALDGGSQLVATIVGYRTGEVFYVSNNFIRMLTGTLFGTALALLMFPRLKEDVDVSSNQERKTVLMQIKKSFSPTHWKLIGIILLCMILVYIIFIFIWKFTSFSYQPMNFLDWGSKLPLRKEDWFLRRQHGL